MAPCTRLLSTKVIDERSDEGWILVGFDGRKEFLNPAGFIQGGILGAMLDEAMGMAVLSHTRGAFFTVTISSNISYMAPAKLGPLNAESRVVKLGKSVGFIEAKLMTPELELIAQATSSARLVAASSAIGVGKVMDAIAAQREGRG